jgi:hypothetical protein
MQPLLLRQALVTLVVAVAVLHLMLRPVVVLVLLLLDILLHIILPLTLGLLVTVQLLQVDLKLPHSPPALA